MIDKDGFRPNVGIILCNEKDQVLWAQRAQHDSWQFPQGGIKEHETPEQAVYRELMEEVGLAPEHVEVLGMTSGWLRYRLPKRYLRYGNKPLCIGQKQRWYLLRFIGSEDDVKLDLHDKPEFDNWRWEDYWKPAICYINSTLMRCIYLGHLDQICSNMLVIDFSMLLAAL